jgi:hypothetical protein
VGATVMNGAFRIKRYIEVNHQNLMPLALKVRISLFQGVANLVGASDRSRPKCARRCSCRPWRDAQNQPLPPVRTPSSLSGLARSML